MFDVEAVGNLGVISALLVIGILIFLESAFLIGLFLPGGDTLLVASGVFAAQGDLPLFGVIATIFIAAVAGDNVGYYIGQRTGSRIFNKKNMLIKKKHVQRAESFYKRHGGKTVVAARFIGYVRTFVPLLAGVAKMERTKFVLHNVFGALVWTVTLVLAGYLLGKELAGFIDKFIVPVSIIGIALLFAPTIAYFLRNPNLRAKLARLTINRKSPEEEPEA